MTPFPLFADRVPRLGRDRIFKHMVDDLIKPTPQSLSLVGPRYSGKTVILNALADDAQTCEAYSCIVFWDLGHQIPRSDEEFISQMIKKVAVAIHGSRPDIHAHLTKERAGYAELYESFELLAAESQRVLMLWDGVDQTISTGLLTRNLWDNLLALGRMDSLVLVTSSRRKLQELLRDPQSFTSDFWLLFTPIRLDSMNEDDLAAFASAMKQHTFQPGALKELLNWTGGIPPLVASTLNQLSIMIPSGEVSNDHINAAALEMDEYCTGYLDTIWNDFPAPVTDLYRHMIQAKVEDFANVAKPERTTLIENGMATHDGGKLKVRCRMLERHIEGGTSEFGAMARLFGEWEGYSKNIRGILERRLAQIPRFDDRLFRMVEQGVENIPSYPDDCLNNLNHIEERALDLIWTHETDQEKCFTSQIISYWSETTLRAQKERKNWIIVEILQADEDGRENAWSVPTDRSKQLSLLQLLTGSNQTYSQPMAKSVSKDTYSLLNAIHSFRNRSIHASGQAIHLGVAVSAVMLCVELLACLQRELQFGNTAPTITQP
jgi:hypothetical protein